MPASGIKESPYPSTGLDPASAFLFIPVPEFINPVFAKTSPKRSFSVIQNERFGLVFAKTRSIISGTGGGGQAYSLHPTAGVVLAVLC